MPTYSYACKACGHQFDAQQSFSDPALTSCPRCEGALRKLFGSVGVVFKGSGFYRTDSRAKTGSKSDMAPKKADKAEQSTATPKAESKTESAPKAKEKVATPA